MFEYSLEIQRIYNEYSRELTLYGNENQTKVYHARTFIMQGRSVFTIEYPLNIQ